MKPIIAVPLVVLALAGVSVGAYYAVAGGGSGGEDAAVAQATPTPAPAAVTAAPTTPGPTPTPTAESPPPATDGGKAPKGCGPSELAYVDPDGRFAFCYPNDMELVTVDTGDGMAAAHAAHPVSEANNRVTVSFGVVIEPYAPCGMLTPFVIKNQIIGDLAIDGKTVQACFRDHYHPAEPDLLLHKSIDFMAAMDDGRPIIVLVTYSGDDSLRDGVPVEQIAFRILDSAAVY